MPVCRLLGHHTKSLYPVGIFGDAVYMTPYAYRIPSATKSASMELYFKSKATYVNMVWYYDDVVGGGGYGGTTSSHQTKRRRGTNYQCPCMFQRLTDSNKPPLPFSL